MGTTVPIVCRWDGKIVQRDCNPEYVGGHSNATTIDKNTKFDEFVRVVRDLCSMNDDPPFTIHCKYFIQVNYSIALEIKDDRSLHTALHSYPQSCLAVLLFIMKTDETTITREANRLTKTRGRGIAVRESNRVEHAPSSNANPLTVRQEPMMDHVADMRQTSTDEDDMEGFSGDHGSPLDSPVQTPTRTHTMDRSTVDDEHHNDQRFVNLYDKLHGEQVTGMETTSDPTVGGDNSQNNGLQDPGSLFGDDFVDNLYVNSNKRDTRRTNDDNIPDARVGPRPTEDNDMHVGQIFPSREDFKIALINLFIKTKREYKPVKSSHSKVVAKCRQAGCEWRIRANKVSGLSMFKVSMYHPHTCSVHSHMRGTDHSQASTKWVASKIKEKLQQNRDMSASQIMKDIEIGYGIQISYRKSKQARVIALEAIYGSFKDSFSYLPSLERELHMKDQGTVTKLLTNNNGSFSGFFWAFGPCIAAFHNCLRPVLSMDGTQLRGVYPGVLLIACGVDGCNGIVPIAFAVVETENSECWSWFLTCISVLVLRNYPRGRELTLITDNQSEIIAKVREVFPSAHHAFCLHHLVECFYSEFRIEALRDLVWESAQAYTREECDAILERIRMLHPAAHDWLEQAGKTYWATSYFSGCRYDLHTTNLSESFEALLAKPRELPITVLVQATRMKVSCYLNARQEKGKSMGNVVTPSCMKILEQMQAESRDCNTITFSATESQVCIHGRAYTVNLENRTCSCHGFQILGIPCAHAVAALESRNLDAHDFCAHWYTSDTYRAAYSQTLRPTESYKVWPTVPNDLVVLPPKWTRPPGRPVKTKIELKSNVRGASQCGKCKEYGHNRRGCNNTPQ